MPMHTKLKYGFLKFAYQLAMTLVITFFDVDFN